MVKTAVSRRGFLAASAGVAMLASAGGAIATGGPLASDQAFAAGGSWGSADVEEERITTLCAGCGNFCGMAVYVQNGTIVRAQGLKEHPHTGGYLCGRGQGYVKVPYAENRVRTPLKADGSGGFQEVSWDEALSDIAQHMQEAGPQSTGWFQDGRGTDSYYTKRLMSAFGSANYYDESALADIDISTVIPTVMGAYPAPSAGKSKCIVLLDKSSYEGVRPHEIEEIIKARENGGTVYVVDPRLCSFGALASEWVPIKPGTELAFLLGVSCFLVENGLHDQAFVEANGNGFDDYARAIAQYTPAWASEKTGIAAEKIEEIARALAEAAPHCYVDLQWAGTLGSGYANSAEQIRALLLLNALLGNFNQEGGLVFPTSPWLGDDALDQTVFIPTGQPSAPTAGEGDFALSRSTSCQAGLRAGLQAAVFCECDPVSDWPDAAGTAEAFDAIPFKAVIATELTPAAKRADYVLPALTFLERPGIVGTATSGTSMATLRNQVIEPVAPDAKAIYEIVTDLAGHLGLSEYFAFTLDDYNEALCAAYDVSYDELRRTSVAELPGCSLEYGSMPFMMSASGKVEFSCDAFAAAGRSATPEWVEPAVQPSDGKLRLITGDQFTQVRTYTLAAEGLRKDAVDNGLDRLWVNPQTAEPLGIADGDRVRVTSDTGETVATARVTGQIHPDAVYLPPHYSRDDQGFSARLQNLIPCQYEPGTGAAMLNETLVTLQKEGA